MIVKHAAIIIRNNKILLTRKKKTSIFISPGGKIEPGETPQECLKREIKEEIDTEVVAAKLFCTNHATAALENKKIEISSWLVEITGDPVPSSEIDELRWISFSESHSMNIGSIFRDHVIPALKKQGLIK